jgi:hypothetical protein
MKILAFKTEGPGPEAQTAAFLRKLAELAQGYAYLVPRGWRCMAKIQICAAEAPNWSIDVQSENDGGPYALAKMNTLEAFPELAASGALTAAMVRDYFAARGGLPPYAAELPDDSGELTNWQREQLRDEAKLTLYHGGLRVPHEALIVNGGRISTASGEILLSFSGASQEQDIFFALAIFKELQQSFTSLYPNVQGWWNLRELAKIPGVRFWLDLLQVKEQ